MEFLGGLEHGLRAECGPGVVAGEQGLNLQEAIKITFKQRGTHAIPISFPDPPELWQLPYAQLAGECSLEWTIDHSV